MIGTTREYEKPEMQRTLVLIKPSRYGPDRVQDKKLVKKLLEEELASCGVIVFKKKIRVSRELAEKHYAIHRGKWPYGLLVEQLTDKYLIATVLEGPETISRVRNKLGATDPLKAAWWTIRAYGIYTLDTVNKSRQGNYGTDNVIHASDSMESADFEIENFLKFLGIKLKPLGHYVHAEYLVKHY